MGQTLPVISMLSLFLKQSIFNCLITSAYTLHVGRGK